MGDLIEIIDTFTIQVQRRMSENMPDRFELYFIYPDCVDHDNITVWYSDESEAYGDLEKIIQSAQEITS